MRQSRGLIAVAVAGALAAGCGEASSELPGVRPTRPTPHCTTGDCAQSQFDLQRDANLRYASRLPASASPGTDPAADVARAQRALARFDGGPGEPAVAAVAAALRGAGFPADDILVATNAVRTAGTAFGVKRDGGCIAGSVYLGVVHVSFTGYVDDGGCLAVYGH